MEPRQAVTAETVARSLAASFFELGYLQLADAVQIVSDEFGEDFLWTDECGRCRVRRDVLIALRGILQEEE